MSSQILSDTFFLFAFILSLYFLIKYTKSENNFFYIVLSGLMLGFATYIRAATFPFIFMSLPIIYYIIKSYNYNKLKVFSILGVYILSALLIILPRLYNNISYNDTYALTSQAGGHLAYWTVPGVLSLSKNLDRKSSVDLVKSQIDITGGLTGDAYKDNKIMLNVSLEILSNQSIFIKTYAWARASFLNTFLSPVLIDKRVRAMKHPSFANIGEIGPWVHSILKDNETKKYMSILIIASIFSILSAITIFIGFYIFFKTEPILSLLSLLIIIYFCLLTGPTLSPKYSLPYVPIIFYLQAIFVDRLFLFIKKR